MSVSLEGREPFLDHRIIEFVARLPSAYKYQNNTGKYILKDIVHRYVDPKIMERPKMGFDPPLHNWLKKELKELFLDCFEEKELRESGVFDVKHVQKLKNDFLLNRKVDFERLNYLFLFLLWYKKWGKV
jgi:asparagine synthase (glutamine-hydrolysing)